MTKLPNWIKHGMQVSSTPWDTQNASRRLRNYDSCMIVGPLFFQSYSIPQGKSAFSAETGPYFANRQTASETCECFNSIKDWIRWRVCLTINVIVFLRMHRELTILLKYSSYVFTIFWLAFWVFLHFLLFSYVYCKNKQVTTVSSSGQFGWKSLLNLSPAPTLNIL